jgi:S-adenosylmethionine-dependent methyltransferase
MMVNLNVERFESSAEKYAAYLDTLPGRLRLDLTFSNLQEVLSGAARSLRVLDLGGGTGAIAVRLARLGCDVTLVDVSLTMLDFAKRAAERTGMAERITLKHGDIAQLENMFQGGSFDAVLCHNVLEYVDDPVAVLRGATGMLGNSSSAVSILVRNQSGEALKSAIQDGDLVATEHNLTAEWGKESLYGGRVRLFSRESLQALLEASSLTVTIQRGVRVLSDYLPSRTCRDDQYEQILELERKLGKRREFAPIARYTHCLAHRVTPATKWTDEKHHNSI